MQINENRYRIYLQGIRSASLHCDVELKPVSTGSFIAVVVESSRMTLLIGIGIAMKISFWLWYLPIYDGSLKSALILLSIPIGVLLWTFVDMILTRWQFMEVVHYLFADDPPLVGPLGWGP